MELYRNIRTASLILALSLPAFASAGSYQPAHVAELYTSQGCSSCPPANVMINEIGVSEDVLTLTFSVTYWDFLGWKDTFGKPEFSQRQRAYAKAFDGSPIYTPQIIVNGSTHGSRLRADDIKASALKDNMPTISMARINGNIMATIVPPKDVNVKRTSQSDAEDDITPTYNIARVGFVPGPQSVRVDAGENSGRTLTLTNVVTSVKTLEGWKSENPPDILVTADPVPGVAYALLMHDPVTRHIVSASVLLPELPDK